MRIALICALAACSFPTKHAGTGDGGPGDSRASDGRFLDGPAGDGATGPFACAGMQFPTTAPPQITISGTTEGGLNNQPIGGVQIQAFLRTNPANPVIQIQSDPNGNFTVTAPTGGAAFDGYGIAQQPGGMYQPTYFYPRRPLDANTTITFGMFTPGDFNNMYSIYGRIWDTTRGTVAFQLVDCNGLPVAGARFINNDPQSEILYADTSGNYTPTLQMTSANGLGLVLDATAVASATFTAVGPQGQAFHTYNNPVTAGALTEMALQP